MRNLYSELRALGFLTSDNCYEILDWINTLTHRELIANGNLNIVGPAGDGDDCCEVYIPVDPIEEYLAKHWGNSSKIQLTSNIKQKFGLPLSEAHQKVCEYSNK